MLDNSPVRFECTPLYGRVRVMKTRKKKSAPALNKAMTGAAIMIALSAAPHQDAHAVTDALDMDAIIIPTGQAILATQNLNFGSISEVGGGTVTVNTAGAVTDSPGAVSLGGTIEEGIIRTFGTTGNSVAFTIPATAILNNGANTMVVDQFDLNGGGLTETIIMTNTDTPIPVGGRLNVGAGQAAGTYTGSVTVTATFN